MKRKILLKGFIAIVAITLQANFVFGQWQSGSAGAMWYGRTNPTFGGTGIAGIGIGSFPNGTPPLAAVHINTNPPFPTNTFWLPGEVFRTTGSSAFLNAWRLWTGGQPGGPVATEKAAFFIPANSNDLVIQTSIPLSTNIRFNVGVNAQRAILTDGKGQGHLGIGNGFNTPQHMIHIHTSPFIDNIVPPAYISFTNTNTSATATDGFLVGIAANGTAELRQQENAPIDIFTNTTFTRKMRITHNATDVARVGIGRVATPLTHLLLGLDVFGGSGYRNWMDIGTLMYGTPVTPGSSFGRDNMYVGLGTLQTDSPPLDAVISWGSNPNLNRLLFIFTAVPGFGQASANGLEVARMKIDVTNPTTPAGFIGIGGNSYGNLYYNNSFDPTATLEVNSPQTYNAGQTGFSGLRFTDLREASQTIPLNPNQGVLSINGNGDVIYVQGGTGAGIVGANNGTSISGGNIVVLGNNVGGNAAQLLSDREIPMHNFNLTFSGAGYPGNMIGIGTLSPYAKLTVECIDNESTAGAFSSNAPNTIINMGIFTVAKGGLYENFGIDARATGPAHSPSSPQLNYAGHFIAAGVTGVNTLNFGIFAGASGGSVNYAGYFNGNVVTTGSCSDIRVKDSINSYKNALSKIRQLKPETFYFKRDDFPSINFPQGKQYGMIAQDVEPVFPELVCNIIHPAQFDTLGNMIYDTIHFKNIDYLSFIPILIQGVKELDSATTSLSGKIDSIKVTADNGITANTNTNVQLGGSLIKDTEINLNNQNLIFTDPSTITGNNTIALGSNLPYSKFSVNNVNYGCAGYFATSTILSYPGYNWGIIASAINGTNLNIGGQFTATDGVYNYGIAAAATAGSYVNMGIRASGSGGMYNYAGYFDGDVAYTGNFYQASDSILKENIVPLSDAMNIISQLEPETFNFRTTEYSYLNLPTGKKYGLTAQDVENVLPEIVTTNIHPEEKDLSGNIISPELTYKGLNYVELIPVMIEGMKEQQAAIDSLKAIVMGANQKSTGNNNNDNSGNKGNYQIVELSTENAIILNQNDPNPFAEETDIPYYLPDDVSSAKIIFYDNTGKIIKAVELIGKGNGTLHVYASNLSSGIYTYALIADGKVVDSKKMMKAK